MSDDPKLCERCGRPPKRHLMQLEVTSPGPPGALLGATVTALGGEGKKTPALCEECWDKAVDRVIKGGGPPSSAQGYGGRKAMAKRKAKAKEVKCRGCGIALPSDLMEKGLCETCQRLARHAVGRKEPEPPPQARANRKAGPARIPDDLAGEIFERLDAVKSAAKDLDDATNDRKAAKETLEKAQNALVEVLEQARSGQSRLAFGEAAPPEEGPADSTE